MWGLVRHWVRILFLGVLGGVLESPNATIVAFGDMARGKAVDLAGAACIGYILVISMCI